MSVDPTYFRMERLSLLEFYASPTEQLEWQLQTPTLDSGEICCWWLDHIYLDDPVWGEAFSPDELRLIRDFNVAIKSAFSPYDRNFPKIEVLLREPAWKRVIAAAATAATRVRSAT